MDIYLVRHAKAEPGVDDEMRALTKGGRASAGRVAALLAASGAAPVRTEYSPLVRAAQTAEIIAIELRSPLAEAKDLRPERPVTAVRERLLTEQPDSIMLVGHNPFMERLASLLICEDPDAVTLSFHTASVARLVPSGTGLGWRFACDWLIRPALVPSRS
ncbi:MAG TPA: phosphohistidine phosphatase SixA [Chloroflexota bacterium]|jgi:phosphohistidine phosphatase|nr:phosphohistidine phosphatase SixA [Chloroflexota bacterium]